MTFHRFQPQFQVAVGGEASPILQPQHGSPATCFGLSGTSFLRSHVNDLHFLGGASVPHSLFAPQLVTLISSRQLVRLEGTAGPCLRHSSAIMCRWFAYISATEESLLEDVLSWYPSITSTILCPLAAITPDPLIRPLL